MENNNYNFNKEHQEPSKEQVSQHKDFDAILQQMNQAVDVPEPKPLRKKGRIRRLWKAVGAAAAVFVGAVLFFLNSDKKTQDSTSSDAYFAQQEYVQPPIEKAVPTFAKYQLEDAYKGGVYEYRSGSRLVIPPKAFVNRSGEIVAGEVDIKYREYHDFVDFFISGIPMRYDSAGTEYILESAGMIEGHAEQDGERVMLHPEREIEVELVANIKVPKGKKAPHYNIYRLDEEKRNWVYQDIDKIQIVEESAIDILSQEDENESSIKAKRAQALQKIKQSQEQELRNIEASIPMPTQPLKPERANENNLSFSLDFMDIKSQRNISEEHDAVGAAKDAVLELRKQYEGTVWEVLPGQEAMVESIANTTPEDATLRPINGRDFEVTFISGEKRLIVKARPVLMGEDYDNAMATFNAAFAKYQADIQSREANLADKKAKLQERIAIEESAANAEYEKRLEIYREAGRKDLITQEMTEQKVLNRFSISSFGVWNCDRPLPPYIYSVKADFKDQNMKVFEDKIAYIVDKDRNTVTRFMASTGQNIRFNNNAENMMWLITEDNKIATFGPEKFKKLDKKNTRGKQSFVMERHAIDINSEEDIRKILKF